MKYIFTLLILLTSTYAIAQYKINPAGRSYIQKIRTEQAGLRNTLSTDTACAEPVTGAIIRFHEDFDTSCLTEENITINTDLGNIAVIEAPLQIIEKLAEMPQVKSISLGGHRKIHMNFARETSTVSEAHTGITHNGQNHSYTGKDVILGIMDIGLDPNHINFLNSDGTSRVERLWHFNSYGSVKEYNASTVSTFTTDDTKETHATHVAGIMAGSYNGTCTYMRQTIASAGSSSSAFTGKMPFYGVATDARLAFSCGKLTDENILNGVKKIIDYAKSQGKPVAVNLSLGSNYGPHDGTDDFSAALDKMGQDAIICISAGNEGSDNMSIQKTFTSSSTSVKTILYYDSKYSKGVDGILDIWASDGQPLTVTISTINSSGTLTQRIKSSKATPSYGTSVPGVTGGSARLYAGTDPNNGRYNVYINFSEAYPITGRFAITVEGKAGQKIDMFFSGYTEFTNKYDPSSASLSGFTAGTPENSINGIACGKNVISVGAYTSRSQWKTLKGNILTYNESLKNIACFSSYGHDFSGRKLPLITAPGTAIASSYSRYYVDNGYQYGSASDMVGRATNGSKTDYWGMMQGTSMSCPYITGIMGLWLQADPSLTVSDMLEVIKNTSITDSYTRSASKRFGYGKIDAAAGLRYILSRASIGSVTSGDIEPFIITPSENGYDVTLAGAGDFSVTVSDIQGRTVATTQGMDNQASIDTGSLLPGIYILSANASGQYYSRKIIVH